MASGWGLTHPIDELEGLPRLAVKLQFIWFKVISLSTCNDLALQECETVSGSKKSGSKGSDKKESQVTTNLTLCVVNPGNPKKGVEIGE